MGFQYYISLTIYYSSLNNCFGYNTEKGFGMFEPDIPKKYLSYTSGRNKNHDYLFLEKIFETYDGTMIFIDEEIHQLLPDVTEFVTELEKTEEINRDEYLIYYETLKEFLYFLGNEADGSWYISVTY